MDNWDLLTDSLKEFHITLTNEQFHQFQNYYELMIEWNSFMNLTAITEMDEVIMKHFVDSVSLIQDCLLYTSPSPRDEHRSRMPSSA